MNFIILFRSNDEKHEINVTEDKSLGDVLKEISSLTSHEIDFYSPDLVTADDQTNALTHFKNLGFDTRKSYMIGFTLNNNAHHPQIYLTPNKTLLIDSPGVLVKNKAGLFNASNDEGVEEYRSSPEIPSRKY